MARKKVDTATLAETVSVPTEDAIKDELTGSGTDTGKYEKPQTEIKAAIEDIGFEEEDDLRKRLPKTPSPELTAPWVEDKVEPKEEPIKVEPQEDLYKKRYEDSVKWNTRLSQDVAELKRSLDTIRAESQKPKEQVPQYSREQLMEWRDRDPDAYYQWQASQVVESRAKQLEGQISALHGAMSGILAKSEADRFASEHTDFNTMVDDIRQELQSMPSEMTTNPSYYRQALNMAYWSVKGRKNVELDSRSREANTREMASRETAKRNLHVEGGTTKVATEGTPDLKNASSREIFKYMQKQGLVRSE